MRPSSVRVASRYLGWAPKPRRVRTAGEVIFKKDQSNSETSWAWGAGSGSSREIPSDFKFDPSQVKPLASALRSTLAALGHAISAHNTFVKVKSARVSPDGRLGGRGYIQEIRDMRRFYMNVVEALSSLSDTLYDEIHADHWKKPSKKDEETKGILQDVEEIRQDPEGWAKSEEAEMEQERGRYQ